MINAPAMAAVSPIDIAVPESTGDIEDAERITHIAYLNEFQVRQRVVDAKWSQKAVDMLLEKRRKLGGQGSSSKEEQRNYNQDNALREGLSRKPSEQIEFREVSTWMSSSRGEPDRRVVVTYAQDLPNIPVKWTVYTRDRWAFHSATFEQNKKRWYSPRGVPEKLDDLEKEVTFQHRQKLNRMMISNAPTFLYRMNSMINPNNFQWIPGQTPGS